MYAQGYGEHSLAQETYREARNGSACSSCGSCVARCANGLDIATKVRDAARLFA
jgi:hypothetical protein